MDTFSFGSNTTITGSVFRRCNTVTNNLATISTTIFDNTERVITTDLSKIINCDFKANGVGNAIEITAPGTYTFSGNQFSGYGAIGTSTAAIFNNSGGLVTINISGGGSTPTYINGSGASTVVNNAITLTLTGISTGSDVVIIQAGTTNQLADFQEITGTTQTYSYSVSGVNIDIGVLKEGYVPFYIRNYLLGSSDASLPVSQTFDRNFI
jgi:hypothetical protein